MKQPDDCDSTNGYSGTNAMPAIPTTNQPLATTLDERTAVGKLWKAEGDRIRCLACGHRCLIGNGRRGICKVRFNAGGELRVPSGYVDGVACDPIEKKPFFHVYPGCDAFTFGMLGCDYHCPYCQNWVSSQALRDEAASAPISVISPQDLVQTAQNYGARLVVSSYNEPLITAEWAVAIFQEAKAVGLQCAFVSNGNATPEVLDYLQPWIVAYKVDLKGFDDKRYRTLGGTLDNVLNGIRMIYERGVWLEIVTLIVPGFNDSDEELSNIAKFIASVSCDIPWHVTAFRPDYRMIDGRATTARRLAGAAHIGADAGLRYVYAGNLPGKVNNWENTYCPACQAKLIERFGFAVRDYRITPNGTCPCGEKIPGIWPEKGRSDVKLVRSKGSFSGRLPRQIVLPRGRF
jgi:pyruvate formate lyase activating enzyme